MQLSEFLQTGRVTKEEKAKDNKGKKYKGTVQSFEGAVKGKVQEWSSKGRTDLVKEIENSQVYSNMNSARNEPNRDDER